MPQGDANLDRTNKIEEEKAQSQAQQGREEQGLKQPADGDSQSEKQPSKRRTGRRG